jgi:hypothetical protein
MMFVLNIEDIDKYNANKWFTKAFFVIILYL